MMINKKTAVILAGGLGTRLLPLTESTPKCMVEIGGKPLIEHQLELLERHGIFDVRVLLGHLGGKARKYLMSRRGKANIRCYQERTPKGTAGALKVLGKTIKNNFLVLSGDVMLDMNVKDFIDWFERKDDKEKIAGFAVHKTSHPEDSDLVKVDKKETIVELMKKPHKKLPTAPLGIASAFVFSPGIFKYIKSERKTDIEKDMLPEILKNGEKVFAYNSPAYIKDMGTPERLGQVKEDYLSGKVKIHEI